MKRGTLVWTAAAFCCMGGCHWLQTHDGDGDGGEDSSAEVSDACQRAHRLEQEVDYDKAREAYEACIRERGGTVDAHLGYQRILEVEDGPDKAAQTYEALVREVDAPLVHWAAARLMRRDERIAALERLSARHPDLAITYYELSRQYAAEEVGAQSLDDQAAEKLYLTKFLDLARSGDAFRKTFTRYDDAAKMLEDAERRLGKLEHVDLSARAKPVELVAMPHNGGWSLTFQVKETAKEVQSKLAGETEWTSGWSRQLPPTDKGQAIQVRYEGVRGEWHGPHTLDFDPATSLTGFAKRTLDQVGPHNWIAVQSPTGTPHVYFTTLFSYRCGIEKVEYGYNEDPPTKVKPLPECDPEDPYAIRDTTGMFEPLPAGTRFISYRLTFADGDRSEVHRLDVK